MYFTCIGEGSGKLRKVDIFSIITNKHIFINIINTYGLKNKNEPIKYSYTCMCYMECLQLDVHNNKTS